MGEASMDELKDSQISRRLSMVMTERLRTELMSGREVVASGRYPYTGRFGILSKEDWAKVMRRSRLSMQVKYRIRIS